MALTPEGKVKAKITKILDAAGAYYTCPVSGGYGRSGVPDFIGCINSKFFGIEAKAEGNEATALQLRELNRIRAAGGIGLLVTGDKDSLLFLEVTMKLHRRTKC